MSRFQILPHCSGLKDASTPKIWFLHISIKVIFIGLHPLEHHAFWLGSSISPSLKVCTGRTESKLEKWSCRYPSAKPSKGFKVTNQNLELDLEAQW